MLEHVPWIVGGVAIGFFVGFSFGKHRGAVKRLSRFELERRRAKPRTEKAEQADVKQGAEPERIVFMRWGGRHYHKEGCRHLGHSDVEAISKEEALDKGLRRCPRCRP
jgi:hypothetical protein